MTNGGGMKTGFVVQKGENSRGCEGKETGEINIKEEKDNERYILRDRGERGREDREREIDR